MCASTASAAASRRGSVTWARWSRQRQTEPTAERTRPQTPTKARTPLLNSPLTQLRPRRPRRASAALATITETRATAGPNPGAPSAESGLSLSTATVVDASSTGPTTRTVTFLDLPTPSGPAPPSNVTSRSIVVSVPASSRTGTVATVPLPTRNSISPPAGTLASLPTVAVATTDSPAGTRSRSVETPGRAAARARRR